jgi:hypothetical protein
VGKLNFQDIKDENGTSLQSYVDVLQAKASEHDLFCTLVFAGKEGSKNSGIHAVTAIDGPPERALLLLAMAMYGLTGAQQREVLAAFAQLKEAEDPVITPVSPGKAN